jgi:hypothetical protein
VPLPRPVATKWVDVLPVFALARSLNPAAGPPCTTQETGAHPPEGAIQFNMTVLSLTINVSPVGGCGAVIHMGVPTTTTTSFDGALVPPAFIARIRT